MLRGETKNNSIEQYLYKNNKININGVLEQQEYFSESSLSAVYDIQIELCLKQFILFNFVIDVLLIYILLKIRKMSFLWYFKKNINYNAHSDYFKIFNLIKNNQSILRFVFNKYERRLKSKKLKRKLTGFWDTLQFQFKIIKLKWKCQNNPRLYLRWYNKQYLSNLKIIKILFNVITIQFIFYLYYSNVVILWTEKNRFFVSSMLISFIVLDCFIIISYYIYTNYLLLKYPSKMNNYIFTKCTKQLFYYMIIICGLQLFIIGNSFIRGIIYLYFY